jgi:RecA/RadA recombinase
MWGGASNLDQKIPTSCESYIVGDTRRKPSSGGAKVKGGGLSPSPMNVDDDDTPVEDPLAERLLRYAVAVRSVPTPACVVQTSGWSDWETARAQMVSVTRYASSVELCRELTERPEDPYHHCVDLGEDRPGIVVSSRGRVPKVARLTACDDAYSQDGTPSTSGEPTDDAAERAAPVTRTLASATKRAQDGDERTRRRCMDRAVKDEVKAATEREKQRAAEARKELLRTETKEERALRRASERAAREEAAALKKAAGPSDNARGASKARRVDEKVGAAGSQAATECSDSTTPPTPRPKPHALHEAHGEADATLVLPGPKSKGAKGGGRCSTAYFPNPSLHVRLMRATAAASLTGELETAFLGGPASPSLRLVVGPPGTGKTSWIVDFVANGVPPNRRVLVCAPSNVTVAGAYARYVETHRPKASSGGVALCLAPKRIPTGTVVLSDDPSARVVFCTVAGRTSVALYRQSFDTVVVDEAAQCPEALSWTLLRDDVRTLVLVGDPSQLSATAVDVDASEGGHTRSAMERLMQTGYANTTHLTVQRRMHPAICRFPNATFYDGSLEDHPTCAEQAHGSLPALVKVNTPVDASVVEVDTSFANPVEARTVAAVAVRYLLDHHGVPAERLVVVVPYTAHCRSVMAALHALDPERAYKVAVHTVDSFQGREADVVLLSVCRVGERCGFWADGRRLNVACTRARKCLCVVGSFDWTGRPLRQLADHMNAAATEVSEPS